MPKYMPMSERYPGRYVFRVRVWLPSGGWVRLDTDLNPADGKAAMDALMVEVLKRKAPAETDLGRAALSGDGEAGK